MKRYFVINEMNQVLYSGTCSFNDAVKIAQSYSSQGLEKISILTEVAEVTSTVETTVKNFCCN